MFNKFLFCLIICLTQFLLITRSYINFYYDIFLLDNLLYTAISLCFLLSFIFYFFTVKHILDTTRKKYNLQILKKTKKATDFELNQIEHILRTAETTKENQLEQLYLLQADLNHDDFSLFKQHLSLIQKETDASAFSYYCSHDLLNLILNNKKQIAEEKGVQVQYDIFAPAQILIPLTDLSSIFFNLLDNAIEAASQSDVDAPYISLSVSHQQNVLSIYLKNSKSSTSSFDHRSTKPDSITHGYGLSIIEDIVQHHNGYYEWKDHNTYFESTLVFDIM